MEDKSTHALLLSWGRVQEEEPEKVDMRINDSIPRMGSNGLKKKYKAWLQNILNKNKPLDLDRRFHRPLGRPPLLALDPGRHAF